MGNRMQMRAQCNHCGGKGRIIKHKCHVCGGRKVLKKNKEFQVDIEKGMINGEQIVLEGESDQSPHHLPGDIM